MSVTDPSGATVFTRTERNPRYCAFGEPDCAIWDFRGNGNAWPDGTPVCEGNGYQATMKVQTADSKKDSAIWNFNFNIAGNYPACLTK